MAALLVVVLGSIEPNFAYIECYLRDGNVTALSSKVVTMDKFI